MEKKKELRHWPSKAHHHLPISTPTSMSICSVHITLAIHMRDTDIKIYVCMGF